jgi:transposase
VKSAEVVDFLQALLRHIPGPLLIIWDRLSAHRSKITRDFIAGQGDRLWVEYLPGYAPELNPVEYIWPTGSSMLCPMSARRTTRASTKRRAER